MAAGVRGLEEAQQWPVRALGAAAHRTEMLLGLLPPIERKIR